MIFSKNKISPTRKKELEKFCRNLSIKFNNLNMLDLAFHHRSYSNEGHQNRLENNERLEFLGDSVLGLATADYLYNLLSENPEGDLAKIKSNVVSEMSLGPIGLRMGIDKLLILGNGEEKTGGRHKRAIIADAVEAVIGAYYLDSGYKKAEAFVLSFIVPEIEKVLENKGNKDYKTMLQEYQQKKYKTCPSYKLVKEEGPDHDRTFWVSVSLNGTVFGPEKGKSKKEAEQNVAKKAWLEINHQENSN